VTGKGFFAFRAGAVRVHSERSFDQGDAMELEPEMLSEVLCEAAEEVPWKKVLRAASQLCSNGATKTREGVMGSFSEKDAGNIERSKDAMAARAAEGDAAAAAAFASLLNAETERQKAVTAAPVKAADGAAPSSWLEAVSGRQAEPESQQAA
jgi:hypothetical protein